MIAAPLIIGQAISTGAMGGAAAGAAASGGLGAALGATLFNPATIGLGIAMGGLAVYQGMQQRKALKRQYSSAAKAAYSNLDNLNDQILQVRRAYYDQTDIASQGFRQGYASLVNSVGTTSGGSVNAVMAAQVANAAVDQLARKTALGDTVAAIEYQKQNVKAQTEGGMAAAQANFVPVGIQAIQGAVQGAQIGMGLNSMIEAASQSAATQAAYESIMPAARAGDTNALAQLQALNAGVPSAMVLGEYGQLFTAPYRAQQQISNIQFETQKNDLLFSQIRRDAAQRALTNSNQRTKTFDDFIQNDTLFNSLRTK